MCRAKSANGDECDCEEYDKPEDVTAPSKCMECGHGKSKHGPEKVEAQPVQPAQKKAKKSTVLDVFTAQSEKHIHDLLPVTSRLADFSAARSDALKDFRVAPDETAGIQAGAKKLKKKGALHGCVATNVVIDHDWTYTECTDQLAQLFPTAFEYARQHTRKNDALWVIASKEYQNIRIVPKLVPTGADLVKYKLDKKTGLIGISLYIGDFHL
ncbi:hypothetical protein B0H17DRAFT_1227836 [Mycena rosella]|uniref:Uncharacterized protein n=1 Tax=Mycena rosella TaxID=1033263 RepID=A0AAD7GAG4_MYCRO|nr:hypothetical protein B0H17DRAFT_1227836 [Mycena rosella]